MPTPVLILPGIGNSGPQHWQTLWERRYPHFQRVNQRDWVRPVCDEWVGVLDAAVMACPSAPVLVAHSLACLLVAHWASRSTNAIHGALLVAIPDPDDPGFPADARGFSPVPLRPFPFPSIVVASTATNWFGGEGAILRYVFFHSIALACLVGLLVYLQARVEPFTAMVVR